MIRISETSEGAQPAYELCTRADVEALINRGGGTPKAEIEVKDGATAVILRLPADVLHRIDAAVKARPIRTPRHTWLLEAVHEKLERGGAE